ncbi:hypothetical protein ONA70_32950 [Micromonospora yasonensis]|uniref:hypothetical protein n=1 Tax=Micromonospora yasonensis TaxID=1128667 RepID=UPI00222E92F8|nr:hypothetical protein [Micromonospora yasonensis]MCW3844894.1 hypothetical protein [Micromonospora yasonensis]
MRRDAQAQGIAVVGLLSALLDGAGRDPLATVKAGGVGVRELTRTARTLGVPVSVVRLLLAVAEKAGLAELDERVMPTAAYDRWLTLGLDRRLAVMLKAWRDLGYLPSSQTGPWVPVAPKARAPCYHGALARPAGPELRVQEPINIAKTFSEVTPFAATELTFGSVTATTVSSGSSGTEPVIYVHLAMLGRVAVAKCATRPRGRTGAGR